MDASLSKGKPMSLKGSFRVCVCVRDIARAISSLMTLWGGSIDIQWLDAKWFCLTSFNTLFHLLSGNVGMVGLDPYVCVCVCLFFLSKPSITCRTRIGRKYVSEPMMTSNEPARAYQMESHP